MFAQVFALYSFVLILVALGLSLFSGEAIRFMVDPRYAGGARIVPVVALAYVFLGIGNYVQLAMYLGHRTGLVGRVSVAAAIINLAANYILISRFGMMGAAVATLIGFVAMAIGSYYCSERVFHMRLPLGRVIRGLCVAIAVFVLGQGVTAQRLGVAIVLKCLLLGSFVAALRLWLLSQEELGTVESLGQRAASKAARFLRFRSAEV